MPYDGSGGFNRVMNWQGDAAAGIKIRADRHDQEDNNFASGLSMALTKDGQQQPTANIPMNGKKLINLGTPTLATDAATKAYVDAKSNFTEAVIITGADAKGQVRFTGTQSPSTDGASRPLGLSWSQADLFFGVKPVGVPSGQQNRWVWNDKADGTGSDVMSLTDLGVLTLNGTPFFNGDSMRFTRTDDGVAGAIFRAFKDSASPATGDILFQTQVYGRNSAEAEANYADWYTSIIDPTANSEDAQIVFRRMVGGTLTQGMSINSAGVSINQDLTVAGATTLQGAITAGGSVSSNGYFVGSQTVAALGTAPGGTGVIQLRPVAYNSSTNQTVIDATGAMSVAGGITSGGAITATGNISNNGYYIGSATVATLGVTSGSAGTVQLRPNGYNSSLNQTTVAANGAMEVGGPLTAKGDVTAISRFVSSTNQALLAPTGAGTILLRPNGPDSTAGQALLNSGGALSLTGGLTAGASVTAANNVTSGGNFISSSSVAVLATTGAGEIRLRPNGLGSTAGQFVVEASNGDAVASGRITSSAGFFIGGGSTLYVGPTGAGDIRLRPNGVTNTSGQTIIASNGDMSVAGGITSGGSISFNNATAAGTVTAGGVTTTGSVTSGNNVTAQSGNFIGGTNAYLGPAAAGEIRLRPNGVGSTSGQAVLAPSGLLTAVSANAGNVSAGVTPFGSGVGAGVVAFGSGIIYSKRDGTASQTHVSFYNNAASVPTPVGSISTSGAATAYNTSSDETLKEFIGPYDPLTAIEIIRADPVRDFTWIASGEYAVGWGAQTSYAVSHDLATPPAPTEPEVEGEPGAAQPGEAGYMPWGMDQSKRTPYLWAALTWALDRIDDLLARVEELEGGAPA